MRPSKKKDEPPQHKSTTANRVITLTSTIFKWGILNDLCSENPVKGIIKNPEKSRHRFLQSEELSNFFESVSVEANQTVRDYILLSLYTGARRSNVLSMRWDQISFQQKMWCIPRTKNDEPLILPLIDEVIDILKKRLGNNSVFVFPDTGKFGHIVEPRFGWRRVLKRAGIEDLRLHDLRRTLGSWQAITGSSTIVIGKSLGHKTQQATAVYARLNLDPVRKSLETATRAMFKAAKSKNKIRAV